MVSLALFDTKRYGELDFVMQEGTAIDLVEIKSGNDYKKHAALNKVLAVEEWKAKQAIVFCKDNVQVEDGSYIFPGIWRFSLSRSNSPKD